MAAWSSELQVHRIAFPLWVFAFTLGFPTIFPTNAPNLRKTSRYILKCINTRRSPNPLQHRGLGDFTWHEWVRRKSSHGFLVRMRSAVRIRPAAPKRRDTHSCVSSFLELHFCRAKAAAREQGNPQRFPPHTPPSLRYAEGVRATKSVDDRKTKTTRQGGFLFFKLRCFFSVLEKNIGFLICIFFNKQ